MSETEDSTYLARRGQAISQLDLMAYNFLVSQLVAELEGGQLDAATPYQRGKVWTVSQQRDLWRSRLQGLHIGSLLINERPGQYGVRYIVDGQQRLEALRAFSAGELTLPAAWFPPRLINAVRDVAHSIPEDFEGEWVSFSDLTSSGRGIAVMNNPLPVVVSKVADVAAEAELYLAINFSGLAQTESDRERALASASADVQANYELDALRAEAEDPRPIDRRTAPLSKRTVHQSQLVECGRNRKPQAADEIELFCQRERGHEGDHTSTAFGHSATWSEGGEATAQSVMRDDPSDEAEQLEAFMHGDH